MTRDSLRTPTHPAGPASQPATPPITSHAPAREVRTMHVEGANPRDLTWMVCGRPPNAHPPPSQGPGETEGRLGAASEPTPHPFHPFRNGPKSPSARRKLAVRHICKPARLAYLAAAENSRDDKERSGEGDGKTERRLTRGISIQAIADGEICRLHGPPIPQGLACSRSQPHSRVPASGLPKDRARGRGIGVGVSIGIHWHGCQSLVSEPGVWRLAVGRIRIDIPTN